MNTKQTASSHDKQASPAQLDGYLRFGAALLCKAFEDYKDGPADLALDAVWWLAFDETPGLILEALDFEVADPLEGLCHVRRKRRIKKNGRRD